MQEASIWRGASVKTSPPPHHRPPAPSAALPRWRAPASRSRSAWKAASSRMFCPLFLTKYRDPRWLSGPVRAVSALFVYPATSLFHCGSARQVGRSDIEGNRTSGTASKIKDIFNGLITYFDFFFFFQFGSVKFSLQKSYQNVILKVMWLLWKTLKERIC